MNELICPKCGSKNVFKQTSYARGKAEGEPTQEPLINPNQCLNPKCGYKWFDN